MAQNLDYIIRYIFEQSNWEPTKKVLKEADVLMKQLAAAAGSGMLPTRQPVFAKPFAQTIEGKKYQFMKMAAPFINVTTGKEELIGATTVLSKLTKHYEVLPETMQRVGIETDSLSGKSDKLSKSTEHLGINYSKLAIRAIAVIPIWMALRTVYTTFINAIQQGMKFLIEFETAMAQIRIVGKGTEEEYSRLGDTVMAFSSIYGISATKALEAAKIFAQQGLKINEIISMTRTSMIGAVVLGEDVTKVAEDLTSAVRAYNTDMNTSLTIVDKWMKVQKEFAVTARDLADATKTAGATAASFGISYDKFLGHITAIIEVTRRSGQQAGNALQMIYTRLLTTAREAVQEIAKVPIYQTEAGKAVMQTTHIFRNASDIIDDVASSWGKLTEAQKIELASQIGSRRQVTPFIALMNNYSRAIDAEAASIMSAGDALTSFNILQDTTAIKITQMRNAWTQLARTIGDTSVFKFMIDSVKNLAEGLIFLANATDYAALKMRQRKQEEIDTLSIDRSRLESLKQLSELENKLLKNKTERSVELLEKVKLSREKILAANPQLAAMDINSLEYKIIRGEVERDRATELQKLRAAEMVQTFKTSPFILKGYSQQRAKDELVKKYGSIRAASREILGGIEKEIQARLAEKQITGYLSEVDEAKIEAKVEGYLTKQKEIATLVEHRADVMKNLGASEEQTLRYMIQQYETNEILKRSEDARLKLTQLRYQLEKEITSKIKEQSDILQKSTEGVLKDWLLGKGTFSDIFTEISNTVREQTFGAVAGGFTERLFDVTGIGNAFGININNLKNVLSGKGSLVSSIENAHSRGGDIVAQKIIAAYSGGTGAAGWSGGVGMGGGIANVISGGVGGTLGTYQGRQVWMPSTGRGKTGRGGGIIGRAGGLGRVTTSALLGYSQYQSSRAGGASQGVSIASGLLTGLGGLGVMAGIGGITSAMAGYAATTGAIGASMGLGGGTLGLGGMMAAFGPVGWIGLAAMAAGLALGAFGGKKTKQTQVEVRTTENRVASKIDVTNRQLEIINRNLIALRNTMETYILPQSAYFAEKRGIEDQFALFSRMGYRG